MSTPEFGTCGLCGLSVPGDAFIRGGQQCIGCAGSPRLRRLMRKTRFTPAGCWEWIGCRDEAGYGVTQSGRRTPSGHYVPDRVHRIGHEELVGPIPEAAVMDHACRNRACWRQDPRHVHPVTPRENALVNSLSPIAALANATACKRGHPKTEANTYRRPDNGRAMCDACRRMRNKRTWAWWAANAERVKAQARGQSGRRARR